MKKYLLNDLVHKRHPRTPLSAHISGDGHMVPIYPLVGVHVLARPLIRKADLNLPVTLISPKFTPSTMVYITSHPTDMDMVVRTSSSALNATLYGKCSKLVSSSLLVLLICSYFCFIYCCTILSYQQINDLECVCREFVVRHDHWTTYAYRDFVVARADDPIRNVNPVPEEQPADDVISMYVYPVLV